MRGLPRDISDFEMKAFFTFDGAERDAINARRGDSHKLGLALHIGFLRMSGRLLGAFRVIPVADVCSSAWGRQAQGGEGGRRPFHRRM